MSGQINIRLDPEAKKKIKIAAAQREMTVADLVKEALEKQYGIRFEGVA
jgi:predicted HicB family RNase H-like nuclease